MAPSAAGGSVSSDEEREDELPTVVVLRKGDVGEDEYHKHRAAEKERSEPNSVSSSDAARHAMD